MVAERFQGVHLERLHGRLVLVEEGGHGAEYGENEEHRQREEDDRVETDPDVMHDADRQIIGDGVRPRSGVELVP